MTGSQTLHRRGVVARRRPSGLATAAVALGAATLLTGPTVGLAADDATSPTSVPAVTVTAPAAAAGTNALSKLPSSLMDIGQSVTVLNRGLLDAEGVASLADALRNIPGITIGGAEGGQIGNNINLNGFAARTDIFLDGFRDRGQYYRDTFALDEVEVLMGPSSMLFGRGSTGGAINQVSKRPRARPATEAVISETSNGLVRGTGDINAPLTDTSALRIAVMAQDGATSTRRQTTVNDHGVAPSYRWGLGTATEVTVAGLIQHNDDRPDYGVSPLNGHPVTSGFDTVYGYSDDRTIQDVTALGAGLRRRFGDRLTVHGQIQYNGVRTDARETASQGLGTVTAAGYAPLPTSPTTTATSSLPLSQLFARLQSHDRVIHDTSLFNQIEASLDLATGPVRHTLLLGVEISHDTYRNQTYARSGTCGGVALATGYTGCAPVLDPPYPTSPATASVATNLATGRADTTAVYANDTLDLTPQVKLVGGVRQDRYSAAITNSINSANTPGATAFPRLNQTVSYTSVRTGVIWRATPDQSYYVSYSTSFNPSLEQLTSTTGLTQPLPPETNTAFEGGGKWEVMGDRLALDAAAFQITQDHSRSQNADNTYTANGTIRVRGGRLGASGKLTDKWQVFGGYAYLDARIIRAIAPGALGKVPSNTPARTATIWTTYDVTPIWQLGGGAIAMSRRYLNNTDLVSVPGYSRLDATLAYRQPHYEVRLNIFNLADTRYYDSLIPSDGGRAVPGSGRTAMVTLTLRP